MSVSLTAAAICFISCHGGPADHFSTFAEQLTKKGYTVQIHATGPALKKFQDRKIERVSSFSLEEAPEEVAKKCAKAAVVITDVGHAFDIELQEALAKQAPSALRLAYYDNPEPCVPGGYSLVATKVMQAAQGVLFANANLAKSEEIPLNFEKRVGLGYYPMGQAKKIADRRASEHALIRSQLFSKLSLEDKGQKVVVYAGGNNDEYFSKAFPAFLQFLTKTSQEDLSQFVILLQQHPGAKEKNLDGLLARGAPIFVSELSSDDSQVVADAMLYYQTSMRPQFVLAGIPTIQVGHNTYEDILVKNGLCSIATDAEGLLRALTHLQRDEVNPKVIEQSLGINPDWADRLEESFKLGKS